MLYRIVSTIGSSGAFLAGNYFRTYDTTYGAARVTTETKAARINRELYEKSARTLANFYVGIEQINICDFPVCSLVPLSYGRPVDKFLRRLLHTTRHYNTMLY